MVLNNLQLINTNKVINIQVTGKLISKVTKAETIAGTGSANLTFDNAVVLPGLINSHDHLDFNLFPQLGTKVYNNYTEWAAHIHENYKQDIAAALRVPEELRVQWGIYKNLLCGVTTVVNHGKALPEKDYLITVLQDCQSLHSLAFEKQFPAKLNNPLRLTKRVAIHVGEGTDKFSSKEIDYLVKWNLLKRKLIGVHGIEMNIEQAKKFDALVWCPASNYFMFNKTANVSKLKESTTICFGSDSTLTSSWDIWDHIRLAGRKTGISSSELLHMLTANPANVWNLNGGAIEEGRDADIVVAKKQKGGSLSNINSEDILLVIHKGEICLYDSCLDEQVSENLQQHHFSQIEMNSVVKYVKGNLLQLMADIRSFLPDAPLPLAPTYKKVAI